MVSIPSAPSTRFMFGKQQKKIIHTIFVIVGIIVIIGMVFLYTPLFF